MSSYLNVSQYSKGKVFTFGLPVIILIIGLVVSYKYWLVSEQVYKQKIISSLTFDANTITKNIELRLNTYQLILKGVQSFFYSSSEVTRHEFEKYIKTLELEKYYPGIQGLGFALLVPHERKNNHINAVQSEGFSDYKIHPLSLNDFYTPIIYMEPLVGKNLKVIGLDIYSLPYIQPHLIEARDTGELSLSRKLTLVQDTEKNINNAAFIMFLPVYKNNFPHETLLEKQKNILGWIDAPFRMSDFISAILGKVSKNIDIEIFDGKNELSKKNMLFDLDGVFFNDKELLNKETFSEVREIEVNDHIWTLTFNLVIEKEYQQLSALLFSIVLSFLTAFLVLSLTTRHSRAIELAKKLTDKYRESELLFRAYVENSTIPMATIALGGDWIMANNAMCKALGYSRDEILNKRWAEFTHPDDLDAEAILIKQLLDKKIEKYSIKKRYIHKNGSILYTQISVQIVCNEASKTNYFAILAQDITPKYHAEQELKKIESRFKDMVNTIDGVVWEADANSFKLSYINEQIKHLTGYSCDEWAQTNFWISKVHPDDKNWVFNHSVVNKDNRQSHDIEYRFLTKNGKQIWIRDLVTVVHENGKPKWLRGIMIDITRQKQDELNQNKLEKQLRQSQKMEALGTLSGGIAHDFNNMLGIMLGNAELLSINLKNNKPLNISKANKYLSSLKSAGSRATSLISQILTFSRMTPEKLQPTNLSRVVNDVIIMLEETIATNIQIDLNIEEVTSDIMANENQLHQIVINLFNNAVHALDKKNGLISISVKLKADSLTQNQFMYLCVTDNGKGIPKENLQRVFDPFFTTKEVGEGTGLGLAVIHGIVENHGAEIKVESVLGEGSVFTIRFPIINNKSIEEKRAITHSNNATGKGCILLVEDELQLQRLYQEFLESLGYTVICANNGAIALEYFSTHGNAINLLLTDLVMPELSGKQLCERIRELNFQIPIILMTGYNEELSKEDKDKLGINHYFLKPIELSALSHIIANII